MTANGNGTAPGLGSQPGIEVVTQQKLQPDSKIYDRVQKLNAFFVKQFGVEPEFIVRVPGRVNIIGEHVDYCGYSVLPMAVSQSIFLAVAKNPDSSQLQLRNIEDAKFQGYDADLKTFRIELPKSGGPAWYNYFLCGIKGVQEQLASKWSPIGMRIAVDGNVPLAAGLSSSSAMEVMLVKESKMSMMVRKQIDESLRNGTPLPLPEPPRPNTNNDPDKETLAILERARNAKRKNLRQIEASGAYNHSYYRPPTDNKMHGEKAKSKLQFTMAGTHLPDPAVKPRRRPREEKDVTEEDLINELLDQINERANWLTEMESMGQGKKYRAEISDQISERLRRIQALESKIKMKADGGFRFVD
ncbi:hypothetical protein KR067_008735 [Drosophila pandora]|nr:hypothetical protein KR067_008735 [Drosophila pandora]